MGVIKRTLQCISCKKDIEYYSEENQKVEGTSIKCKCGIELVCTKKTKNLEAWKVKEGEEIC